jgi:CheY-like chemotaxis protein
MTAPSAQPDPAVAANTQPLPESVLIVEDEPYVRALVQDILAGEGYPVVEVGDPWQALGVVETQRIRLLLTDVMMPEMNGCELARRVESICPDTKVLFMSAGLLDDLLEPGTPFVAKPFSVDRMVSAVHEVLSR